MDLTKAIEFLQPLTRLKETDISPDLKDAIELGIEALKRVQAGRPAPPSLAFLTLPGEQRG